MIFALATLLAASPPTGFSRSVERVAVKPTSTAPALVVDPLTARVRVTGATVTGRSRLCPIQRLEDGGVTLICSTRKLWAELDRDAHGSYIDLRELTSVPWSSEEARIPLTAWSLSALLIPDHCPGHNPASRGECALGRGDFAEAKQAYQEALTSPDLGLAHLRLGDLALRDGNVEEAMGHYAKVVPVGPIGRLAQARSCELVGTCFNREDSAKVANVEGLQHEFARELKLYALRRDLLAGRDVEVMARLTESLQADAEYCAGALPFCQKLVEAGLLSEDVDARIGALSVFLVDQVRHGPREQELSLMAAQTAQELGAPGFAAAVLASNTPHVPVAKVPSHLLEVTRLYLAANDRVRAGVILEYAETKFGAATRTAAWNQVRKQLGRTTVALAAPKPVTGDAAELKELEGRVALTTDLARAAKALGRAVDETQEERTP